MVSSFVGWRVHVPVLSYARGGGCKLVLRCTAARMQPANSTELLLVAVVAKWSFLL
jgi:hypothetical protein